MKENVFFTLLVPCSAHHLKAWVSHIATAAARCGTTPPLRPSTRISSAAGSKPSPSSRATRSTWWGSRTRGSTSPPPLSSSSRRTCAQQRLGRRRRKLARRARGQRPARAKDREPNYAPGARPRRLFLPVQVVHVAMSALGWHGRSTFAGWRWGTAARGPRRGRAPRRGPSTPSGSSPRRGW